MSDVAKTVAAKLAAKMKAEGAAPAEIAAAVKAALAKIGAGAGSPDKKPAPQIDRLDIEAAPNKFVALKGKGYRLGQLCALNGEEGVELIYSFTNGPKAENYLLPLGGKTEIESVTNLFPGAFIYENEIHDLFGITFNNLSLDFGGHFFKLKGETPWKAAERRPDNPNVGANFVRPPAPSETKIKEAE